MSDAVMVPREPTDEMLRAHLACDFPAMFREHLRYPMAGPDTAADQERMIAKARKRWSAMLAASPSVGGWEGSRPQEAVPTEQANGAVVVGWCRPVSEEEMRYIEMEVRQCREAERLGIRRVMDVSPETIAALAHTACELTAEVHVLRAKLSTTPQPADGCSSNEGAE